MFNTFRRGSGNKSKDGLKDKKHVSDDLKRERKSVPIEEDVPDPIRHVDGVPRSRPRVSNDDITRARGYSDSPNKRSSPLGPRDLQKPNNGERAPYEPKYFPHSNSMSCLGSPSPTKKPSSVQGARSMSQASQRNDSATKPASDYGGAASVTRSGGYPQRTDSKEPPLRRDGSNRDGSNRDDEAIFDLPLSQAYDIRQGVIRHAPAVLTVDSTASVHGVLEQASPSLGTYPNTPKRPKQRSKLNQETFVDNFEGSHSTSEQHNGITRWGTYSAQGSPKAPLTPNRAVSNGAEMQEWLKQNAKTIKQHASPGNMSPKSKYELSPRLQKELERFEHYKKKSHQRKISIEGVRKAQEALIVYPQQPGKRTVSGTVRSPELKKRNVSANHRSPARIKKPNPYGSIRKVSEHREALPTSYANRIANMRLSEVKGSPAELPSPFLRPEEKAQQAIPKRFFELKPELPSPFLRSEEKARQVAPKKSFERKPVPRNGSALPYSGGEHTLRPIKEESESEASPEPISKRSASGRSRLPTPTRPIKRKTLNGPSAFDLAKKRALEYENLAERSPYEDEDDAIKFGLPRSVPELNMAIKSISTPTYEEIDSELFEFPELVPRPLNVNKRSSNQTIRSILARRPTMRNSKTQGPHASKDKRSGWGHNNRTKSDDFKTLNARQRQQDSYVHLHEQIDEYLDVLLKNRIESKIAEEKAANTQQERSFSRTTVKTESRESRYNSTEKFVKSQSDQSFSTVTVKRPSHYSSSEEVANNPYERPYSTGTVTRESRYSAASSDFEDDRLNRANIAAEKSRWEELTAEEAASGSSPGVSIETIKERMAKLQEADIQDIATDEEVTPTKPEGAIAKPVDRWAEMRAQLRVESTYSDLSSIYSRAKNT